MLLACLIVSAGTPMYPRSIVSFNVALRLGGELLSVIVPPRAYCLFAMSWFCQVVNVRSIALWCRKNAGSEEVLE